VIHHLTRATRHLLFWSLIAIAVIISVTRVLLADVEDYKSQLEEKIFATTALPVRIGKMTAGMRGFNPQIIVQDIRLEGADQTSQPPLQLQEVRIGLDMLDLLLTRDWLSSCWVSLVGAKISVTRTLDGRIDIQGLPASHDEKQPLWLLQGGRYEILQSDISWQDLQRKTPAVRFEHFNLLLKNHFFDGSHEIHLLSDLPTEYGHSLRLSARLTGDVLSAADLAGSVYIEGVDLQATALAKNDLPAGLHLQSGAGDIRLWSEWRDSHPYKVAGYVQAQQVNLSHDQDKTLHLDTFEGNFAWSETDHRWRLAGYDINIFAHHQRWPDGEFYLQRDAEGNLSGLIKQLDLAALMHLAPLALPADSEAKRWLALNPRGRLRDFSLYLSNDFQHYALLGKFAELGNDNMAGIPQLQHVTGQLSVTDGYGQVDFTTDNALLNAPDWFRNPLDIKRLHGQISWWQDSESWQFFSDNLQLDSADFQTVSALKLWLPKGDASPFIALRTGFGAFNDINKVPLYLPAKIMAAGAVDWLDNAFVAGQIKHGEMLLTGPLDQFPFNTGQGRFETVFAIENGEIQFNQDWPHLQDVYADVQFLGEDLQVGIASGHSEQVDIHQALVTIPALPDSDHVYVWGQVQSKLTDSLLFLQKSPLRAKVEPMLKLLSLQGDTQVDLDLKIPYSLADPVKVKVDAHLNNAQLTVNPVNLKADGISGVITFTEDRVSSPRIDARTLGFPVQASLSGDNLATYLSIDGVSSIEQLEKQFAFLQTDVAQGVFSYKTLLTLPYEANRPGLLNIYTPLRGVSIDSRDNLAKTAEQDMPLNLDFQLDDSAKMPLDMQYGEQFKAALLIDKNQNRLHSGHIVFGSGQASRYEPAGLKLEIRQAQFNLSQAAGAFSESSNQASWPALREVLIDTQQLVWQGQALGALHCQLQHHQQAWQGNLDSPMAKGRVSIPDQRGGTNRINLQMDYLNLSAMDGLNFDAADEVVSDLPLIDIDSQHLLWRSQDLGTLKLQTERLVNGIHFKKIQLRGAAKRKLDLSADWIKQPAGTATLLNGSLSMEDFGAFLSELGFSDDIKETNANISFNGGWRGAPHQFALSRLNGQLQLDLQDGRISSIEPGFGRLLGLIAMEQWVKRLSLDFSDVYRQGLAFDRLNGHFKIKDGLAYTDDLQIDAVAAKFNIAGVADLANKTLDHRVAVVPKSSDALPIAGTIVGGIATMITQVLTDDYKEGYFFGSQYQLAGPWGNVEVTPMHAEDGLINKTWRGLTDFGWLDSITQ